MANARYYSANAQPTALGVGISNTATAISLSPPPVGWPSLTPFIIALDYNTPSEEIVLVTSLVGSSATIVRAYDGTSGTSHNAGAGVRHTWSAIDGTDSRTHEASSTGVHGISNTSSVVGTTDSQVLTNKTLVAPTVSGLVSGNGNYVGITASPSGAGLPGFIIEGEVSQTGDLQEWQNSSAAVLSKVDAAGVYHGLSGLKAGATDQWSIGTDGIPHATAGEQIGSSNQFTVDASGNFGTTGSFSGSSNVNTGAWTAYTPTWSGLSALGASVSTGKWSRNGRLVTAIAQLNWGAGSTMGSGQITFSLPVAPVSSALAPSGASYLEDTVASAFRPVTSVLLPSASVGTCFSIDTSQRLQNLGVAYGWASGSIIHAMIQYESAT